MFHTFDFRCVQTVRSSPSYVGAQRNGGNRGEVLPHKVLTLRSPSRVVSFTTLFEDPSRLRVCGLSIMTKQRFPDSH